MNKISMLGDTLTNLVAGLGGGNSKKQGSHFTKRRNSGISGVNRDELIALYQNHWLAEKMINIIPEDCTREWRSFTGDIEPEQVAALVKEEERLNIRGEFLSAHRWARLFGVGYLIIVVDDGLDPSKPLDIDNIKEGSLKGFKSADRWQVSHADVIATQNMLSDNYGKPEYYRINNTAQKIHNSRVVRFEGVELPYYEFQANGYAGDSVLSKAYDAITNYETTAESAAELVVRSNVNVVKIKDLLVSVANDEDTNNMVRRWQLAGMQMSNNNLLLLDSEEELETNTVSFAGLDALIDTYKRDAVSSSGIPMTRFLGEHATGLGSTGEHEMRNYYDLVRSTQVAEYKPKLEKLDKIIAQNIGLPIDSDLSFEFKSLYTVNETEQATIQNTRAQRDITYLNAGVITEAHIAKELRQEKTYTNITEEDIEELEADIEELDEDIDE